LELWYICG